MRSAITAAGLPLDCQPHGLRKAAGRRLAEAGCTAHEIMAVLGHKTLSEAERYTREADQARLASTALAKLEGRTGNKNAQTTPDEFGNGPKH
jgi:integrase